MRQRSLYRRALKLNGCFLFERLDDRFCCMLVQFFAQFGTVIRFVAEHAFGSPHSADQAIGNWTIVRFASGQ